MLGGGEHHGAFVAVLLQGVEQCGGETEIPLHELTCFLGAVHSGEIEYEIGILAVIVKLLKIVVDVIFIDGINLEGRACAVLAIDDVP